MLHTLGTMQHTSHRFYVNVAEIGRPLRADLPLVDTGRDAVAKGAGSETADMVLLKIAFHHPLLRQHMAGSVASAAPGTSCKW